MPTTEAKPDLLELAAASSGVLGNPMLRAIIQSAPSAKAAWEHAKEIGLETATADAIQAGVRLRHRVMREQGDKMWGWLINGSRHLSGANMFDLMTDPPIPLGAVKTVNTLNLCGTDLRRFSWPLLLRDFLYPSMNSDDELTTLDCTGGSDSWQLEDLDDPVIWDFGLALGQSTPAPLFSYPPNPSAVFYVIATTFGPLYTFKAGELEAHGRNVTLKAGPKRAFPEFYKVLWMTKTYPVEPRTEEEVRIILRQDWGSQPTPHFGKVECRRRVETGAGYELMLKVTFGVALRGDNTLGVYRSTKPGPYVTFGPKDGESPLRCPTQFPSHVLQAAQGLFGQLDRMMQKSDELKLEKLAGDELITNPPATLGELFV